MNGRDFRYDHLGNLQSETAYGQVDALGEGIADASTRRKEYVYDATGQLLQAVDLNGPSVRNADSGLTTESHFDDSGRVIGLSKQDRGSI